MKLVSAEPRKRSDMNTTTPTATITAAVDLTRALVRRRAADNPALATLAAERLENGFERFGQTRHLTCGDDWLQHALEELVDCHNYLCFQERTGGRVPGELWAALGAAICGLMALCRRSGDER